MKKAVVLFALVFSIKTYSQNNPEKNISSKVNAVTVFLENAQITRNKNILINKGTTTLKFTGLSPFIDSKSIQIKSKNIEIQSVTFQKNFLKKKEKNKNIIALEKQLEKAQEDIQLQRTYKEILKEELLFLKGNRNIGGKNQTLSVNTLKEAASFYASKLRALKLREIEINKKLKKLNQSSTDLRKQINEYSSKKKYPSGEIIVKVKTNLTSKNQIQLVYIVTNASWFPTYDIRVKDISKPLVLVYKANVKQNTKVNWNNVKIRFSSAKPTVSSIAPELKTYYINYGTLPPSYHKRVTTVSGKVTDNNGALPGVSILVEGTSIGTETDFDGNYSLSIPKNASRLSYSYLGYKTAKKQIYSSSIDVKMEESEETLDEVVVVSGLGMKRNKKSLGYALSGKTTGVKIRGKSSFNYSIPTQQISNQTTVSFEIVAPYSLESNNKSYAVGMKTYELPSNYKYLSIPKIDKNAFLIANISDWEQYNLLEGEANVYFENTYIGKSLLDVRFSKKVLKISLGRDKNIIIQREKEKDFTERQYIGSKKIESRVWNISVKNNKKQKIDISIFDQVPVSTQEEIKITIDQIVGGGNYNNLTGKIKWDFILQPSKSKTLKLKYSIKYPKKKKLIFD